MRKGFAIPALNVNNMETVQAIVSAAEAAGSPVFVQISPGAIDYAGYETISSLAFSAARKTPVPVLVHLDHCRDPAVVQRAIADGYPSVMFDGSGLPLDENIRLTRSLVEQADVVGTLVEAELGAIGGSESTTLHEARAAVTSPDEAARFVSATGVGLLAPAIGTLHRMPENSVTLEIDLVRSIFEASGVPLALHGGSGIARGQLREAIGAGVVKLNISSRIGHVFAVAVRDFWEMHPGQFDIRRFMGAGRNAVRDLALQYMELCGSGGRVPSRSAPAWSDTLGEPE